MTRLLFAFPLMLVLAVPAQAASTPSSASTPVTRPVNCSGVFSGREIFGDVQVPAGRTCTITNTAVHGNINVAAGASLIVKDSNIQGSIKTESKFARLGLSGAIVGAEIKAAQGGSFALDNSQVIGTVTAAGNSGSVRITRVTINGDLNCWGNRSAPTGTWIRVDGVQSGQCRRL